MYPASSHRTVIHRPAQARVVGASAVVPAHSSHPGPKPRGLPAAVWSPRPFRPSLALVQQGVQAHSRRADRRGSLRLRGTRTPSRAAWSGSPRAQLSLRPYSTCPAHAVVCLVSFRSNSRKAFIETVWNSRFLALSGSGNFMKLRRQRRQQRWWRQRR